MSTESSSSATSTSDATILSIKSLLLASAPLLLVAVAGRSDLAHTLGVPPTLSPSLLEGCLRTMIQLSLLGSFLRPIFQANSPLIVLAYTSFMITLAAYETTSRTTYQFEGQFVFVLASLAGNVGCVAAWAFGVILRPRPVWWNPRYVIPIVGMLLGNSISAISLSLNSLTTSLVENRSEIEFWLSLGATPPEATRRLVRQAIQAGTTPILNTMRVIGIISIPGMMTGQLLGGSSALTAAKYQIFIILMIATCVFAAVLTNAFAVVEYIGFDPQHAFLHTHRLTKNRRPSVAKALTMVLGMIASPSNNETTNTQTKATLADSPLLVESSHTLEIRPLIQQSSVCLDDGNDSTACTNPPIPNHSSTLHLRGASKSFSVAVNNEPSRPLFQNLSFSLASGDLILVKGPSGSGKSTLLRGLAGLAPLDQGTMSLGSADWDLHFATHTLAAQWRQQIRYVVQSKVELPGTPADTIVQMSNLKSWQYSTHQQTALEERAREYLKEWGFVGPEEALTKEWSQLSGGETQRILTAITLASQPKFVLFDESTSALDKTSKVAVENSVKAFVRKGTGGVLWISHDEEQAERMSMPTE